jgi:hypothetical protein
MKLTKTSWIILIIGVLVIAAGCLGWIYSQQLDRQKQLDTQFSAAQKKLALIKLDDLNSQKEQFNQQIQQINALMAENKDRLQAPGNSIDTTNAILEDAKSHRIDILSMTSPGRGGEQLAGTEMDTLAIDIQFTGNINDIVNFAISLNEKFPTSIENLVQMDRIPPTPTPTPTETPTPTPNPTPTTLITPVPPGFTPILAPEKNFAGSINLVIYNYKGN